MAELLVKLLPGSDTPGGKNWLRDDEGSTFVTIPLPSYTTERYYLISELEQATDGILSLDGSKEEAGDGAKIEELKASGVCLRMFYMIWPCSNTPESLEVFKSRAKELLGNPSSASSPDSSSSSASQNRVDNKTSPEETKATHGIIAVEVLLNKSISSTEIWNKSEEINVMRQAMNWLVASYGDRIGCAFFGAANDAAGTPALEALHDFLSSFRIVERSQTHDSTRKLCLPAYTIAKSKAVYLGHDATRDPDAKSDVFQVLVSSGTREAVGRFKSSLVKVSIKHPLIVDKKFAGDTVICKSSFVNYYLDYIAILLMICAVIFAFWIGL